MTPTLVRRPHRATTAAAAALLALALAACSQTTDDDGVASLDGGGSGTTSSGAVTAEATTGTADAEAELLAYVECLRGEGLDVPDPTVDGDGDLVLGGPGAGGAGDVDQLPDQAAFEAATEVCGDVPEGAVAGLEELDSAEFEDAALEFARCMRDNGVDVPDPDLSGGAGQGGPGGQGGGGPFGDAVDTDDPEVAAALEECQQVFADTGVAPGGQP